MAQSPFCAQHQGIKGLRVAPPHLQVLLERGRLGDAVQRGGVGLQSRAVCEAPCLQVQLNYAQLQTRGRAV